MLVHDLEKGINSRSEGRDLAEDYLVSDIGMSEEAIGAAVTGGEGKNEQPDDCFVGSKAIPLQTRTDGCLETDHDGIRAKRKSRERRHMTRSPRARSTDGESMVRTTRARSQPRDREEKLGSRSITRRKQRSNSVENLCKEEPCITGKTGDPDSNVQGRPRSRSRSRFREGDKLCRLSGHSARAGRTAEDCREMPSVLASTTTNQRSRSKSKSRQSRGLMSRGQRGRAGSHDGLDLILPCRGGKDVVEPRKQMERSMSRARRFHPATSDGNIQKSKSSGSHTNHTNLAKGCKESRDSKGGSKLDLNRPQNHPTLLDIETLDRQSLIDTKERSKSVIEAVLSSNQPPDPSGRICSDHSITHLDDVETSSFSKEIEGTPKSSKHSAHRRRPKTIISHGKSGSYDRMLRLPSMHQSCHSKPKKMPLTLSRSTDRDEKRKSKDSAKKREKKKSLSYIIVPHQQAEQPLSWERQDPGENKLNELAYEKNSERFRNRPNSSKAKPLRSASCPLQVKEWTNVNSSNKEIATLAQNIIPSEKHVRVAKNLESLEGEKNQRRRQQVSLIRYDEESEADQVDTGVRGFLERDIFENNELELPRPHIRSKSFSSIDDSEDSIAPTLMTSGTTVPGIFGHLNGCGSSIATKDIDTTLAPYLLREHSFAYATQPHESNVSVLRTTSVLESLCPLPGTLDALLDSNAKEHRVAESSLVSLCPTRTLDSLLDLGPRFSALPAPSICTSFNSSNKTQNALLDGRSNNLFVTTCSSFEQKLYTSMLPVSFPPSLDSLLNREAQQCFPTTLDEPSIFPDTSFKPTDQSAALVNLLKRETRQTTIPEEDSSASSQAPARTLTSNTAGASREETQCWERFRSDFDSLKPKGITRKSTTTPSDRVSKLLPLSDNVKIHRAIHPSGKNENLSYLQLDLGGIGTEPRLGGDMATERDSNGFSRAISLRKSLLSFRKTSEQHESLL